MTPGPFLLLAAIAIVLGLPAARIGARSWIALTLLACTAALVAAVIVLATGGANADGWEWRNAIAAGGEEMHLRLDGISAMFLALLAAVGGAGAVYSCEYWTDAAHPRSAPRGRAWWCVLLASLGVILVSSNGLHFLIAWEIFTVASFFLITLDSRPAAVRKAGWLYLAASHVGTVSLFAFFGALAARTGSWDLGPVRGEENARELAPLFWIALLGFGIKCGAFPLHIWLPSAHANAPSHVSAILSGVTIKMGIYGLVRFGGWLPVPSGAGWVVATLGVVSAVLGVAFALGQHDLKRLLAYHSVENIGIILIGLGFAMVAFQQPHDSATVAWGALALAGGLLHVWNHGLFKALLFLGAGSVLHATGTREMSRLGGLWRAMPWTTALFALGAAAISGLPPLNGFVSEWLVYLGLFDAAMSHGSVAWTALPAAILLGMTGALALACFVKVCGVVFLGAARSAAAARARECGFSMRAPMLLLAGACVAIGIAPALFWPAIARAVAAWRPDFPTLETPPSLVAISGCAVTLALLAGVATIWLLARTRHNGVSRAVTWDCGYALPTARMQYTAGSFAGIITEWFAWILQPRRHEEVPGTAFPVRASFEQHTPETVLDHVVAPAGGLVMRVSASVRRLQHGRVQSYVFYVVVGLAALGALVLIGGGQ